MAFVRALALVGMGILLPGVGMARAAEPESPDRARAAALAKTGMDAANAKQWDPCIQALSEALAIEPTPITAGQLGLCEEQKGKLVAAYDHLRSALDAAPSPAEGEPWKSYERALGRMMARVGVVWLTVVPREARVLLDGRPLGRVDGRSFAIEPGEHTFVARLDGYVNKEHSLTVRGGDVPHVHIALDALPKVLPNVNPPAKPLALGSEPAPAMKRTPLPEPAPTSLAAPSPGPVPVPFRWCLPAQSPRGVLAPLACAGLATTLVSSATALGLELDRRSLRSQLPPGACAVSTSPRPATCDALIGRAAQRDAALDATIGAAVATGALSVAAAIAAALEPKTSTPLPVPAAGPGGGGIVLVGVW